MDSFAVSLASGAILKKPRLRQALIIALFFGVFQAVMPVLGWLAGFKVTTFISGLDHWIAFGLLAFIGTRMIMSALRSAGSENQFDPLKLSVLLTLAVATSIDAAAVGLSFSCLKNEIIKPATIIGIVTFIISFAGVYLGIYVGKLFSRRVVFFGGILLIGIGIKILIDHMS